MNLSHGNHLRLVMAALILSSWATGASTARAQGFGPDPFRPYNSQYDPYVYPIGPASPEAGQGMPMNGNGARSANQYQNFLNDLQGPSVLNGERYGIGQPYFRSTVHPDFARQYRPAYQPKAKMERSFEETQRLINEKYFAYFQEKDPKKRARLLRDFHRARAFEERALSARRESPSSLLESSIRGESDLRSLSTGRSVSRSSSTASTSRSSVPTLPGMRQGAADSSRTGRSRSLPASPALPFDLPSRTGAKRTTTDVPSDVLNRARSIDRPLDPKSKATAKDAKEKRSSAIPPPPSLFPRTD